MEEFNVKLLKQLYVPSVDSHKGQNGKLLLVGGSQLFHAASLWALTVASRIVDMVYYSSVAENNEIVRQAKEEFRNGIVVPRSKIDSYADEADVILIGPGMPRPDGQEIGDDDTRRLTKGLFKKFPDKQWVVDGGSLQVIAPEELPKNCIITPHQGEFGTLIKKSKKQKARREFENLELGEQVQMFAKEYGVVVLLKGEEDIVCSSDKCVRISGGNAGMTKGGTGDVLAGLVAALACKNDLFLSATAGSYFNKKAGESLYKRVGLNFNASDLASEIPGVMKTF